MKDRIESYFTRNREALSTRTAKVGGYSFVLGLVVLAILIAVNVLAEALPSKWTQFDISAAQLYSVTSDTKVVVTNLEQDVTIYWISQADAKDEVIGKLLERYKDLSDHITVSEKDPDAYPTFAAQYTDETVENNSLVVVSGDRYRYIPYSEIYQYDTAAMYMGTSSSVSASFDGEGRITSAINYVTTTDLPQLYLLSGHGEAELSDSFTSQLERANMETQDLNLLAVDDVPEDCSCIVINSPTSDISTEEQEMLEEYLDNGGHVLVFSGPQQETELTNLNGLLEAQGVTIHSGIVVESDRDYYAFGQPYILMPTLEESDITTPLSEEGYHVLVPVAGGLTVESTNGNVTTLLQTSDTSFCKAAGYSLTTYDKEDGDEDGPFALAVAVQDSSSDGRLVWVASDNMLEDAYNSYSSGANVNFAVNAIKWIVGDNDSVSIGTKSLDYNYLTISASSANLLKIMMLGVLPVGYLLMGIDEVIRRRRAR